MVDCEIHFDEMGFLWRVSKQRGEFLMLQERVGLYDIIPDVK